MIQVNIYIESSNRSPRKADGTVIYILEAETTKGPVTKTKRVPFHDMNANESLLEGITDALEQLVKPCEIKVFTSSGYIANGINLWLKAWSEAGWERTKGREIKHIVKWSEISGTLNGRPLTATLGNHQYLSWLRTEVKNGE